MTPDNPPRRGQALIEVAVLGSLALLALTLLIQLGLRMNYQQELQQNAFRRALITAKNEGDDESQAVQYNYFRNRRLPNPSEGFGITPRVLAQGSGTVTWGEWLTYLENDDPDSEPRIIVSLDDQSSLDRRSGDFPDHQPLISRVDKDLTGSAEITQDNAGSTLTADSNEHTEMTLSNGEQLSSDVPTPINYNWEW